MVDQAADRVAGQSGAGAGVELRTPEGDILDPLVQAQCSLAVQLRRASGSIIGRTEELAAIGREIKEASTRLAAVTLEGEPGIGKTRLLLAACDLASEAGFTVIAVTADEEIRGPFLVARSIFAAQAIRDTAAGTPAEAAVRRVIDAMGGRDEPGFESLSPEAKLLRAFDLAGVAVAALAAVRPLALYIDDVQWADDDTLRMLRYVVRSDADLPIFLFLTVRPDEFAAVTEAVNFVADMERMGLVRRLRPGRFSQIETAELLRNVLGGPVEPASAAAMQVQSEGVPFIVEELARTHREAGTLHLIEGQWKLGRNAARLVPSAVRTLIQRRATRLPAQTREALADAAVLGRSFSLRDLRAVRTRFGADGEDLADALHPAVEAGLLLQHPEGDAADYTFTHVQVRDFADGQLSQSRRRGVHGAVVELLLEGGDPSPAGLPMLAQHALAAGDTERAAQFSIDAARAALQSNAPEEALRLVDQALPVVSTPADRRILLATRDDAYAVLRRTSDRLQGLAELGALTEALRDPALEFDVQLRRAAALRMAHDEDAAAELARRVAARAAERGETEIELRAYLELGQALLKAPTGEANSITSGEVDVPGAEAAYRRAAELAEQLGDERSLAGALRELGVVVFSRIRDWYAEAVQTGAAFELAARVAAGESLEALIPTLPIAPDVAETRALLERALALYERLGDRTGVMSTVIAMAYASYAGVIHVSSSARHLEEIRRVTSRLTEFVTESERARLELQMLFGVHVYARAKVVPDLMLSRGEEAYRAARLLGDQATEFNAAGGVALSHLELGDVSEAERWLGLAAGVVSIEPTPNRARRLELWRGMVRASAGDAEGMRRHLEGAVALATSQGRASARCEALARLALESARLGAATGSPELLDLAERSALAAKEVAALLPGHPVWRPQADAALSAVALARGDVEGAVVAAGDAIQALQGSGTEDGNLEISMPVARAMFAGGPPEVQAFVRSYLQIMLARIAQGTLDEAARVRWLQGPVGRELVSLVGPFEEARSETRADAFDAPDIDDVDRRLLRLLTEGNTNAEMAEKVGLTEEAVGVQLARLLARLGVSNRAEATSLAFRAFAR
ncbi:MAG TPA: AAA family ATPase [Candidatus Limnocylindria bacterium]|nr:AAA family ATPase [Candidatus Limnocylindria bacterium]